MAQRNIALMFDIPKAILSIEARAKSAGVPIRRICEAAGVAPSNWNRWKTAETSPTFETWGRVERAIQQVLPPEKAASAA